MCIDKFYSQYYTKRYFFETLMQDLCQFWLDIELKIFKNWTSKYFGFFIFHLCSLNCLMCTALFPTCSNLLFWSNESSSSKSSMQIKSENMDAFTENFWRFKGNPVMSIFPSKIKDFQNVGLQCKCHAFMLILFSLLQ